MAVLARRAVDGPLTPRRTWLRWAAPFPATVLADRDYVAWHFLGVTAFAALAGVPPL